MLDPSCTVFASPIGPIRISWSERGIDRVEIGVAMAKQVVPLPLWVATAQDAILRHLAGDSNTFAEVPLDLEGVLKFHRRVYRATQKIPVGTTESYGGLACRLGKPGAARAVGQALARNPLPILVPCHRVLAAGGRPGGFTAQGGLRTKAALLEREGVTLRL